MVFSVVMVGNPKTMTKRHFKSLNNMTYCKVNLDHDVVVSKK